MKRKTKKKLIIIIVAAVLAVALLAVGTVYTVKYIKENVGDSILSLESKTALAGDTIKLSFTISKNHGLWGGQIVINYDADNLTFVSCANGVVFDECEANATDGGKLMVLVTQSDLENTDADGVVATLNFEIKDSAAKGDYDIEFSTDTNLCDIDEPEDLIVPLFENGKITVK